MLVRSGMGLECRLAVVGHSSTVFDLRRVVEVVSDQCCMLEDMFDHCSS